MFIRSKTIHGKPYGYLVESVWTPKGVRQKARKYLGRIYQYGPVTYEQPALSDVPSFFSSHLVNLLVAAGFEFLGHQCYKDGIVVNIAERRVLANGNSCVLAINEGFLCDHTLSSLFAWCEKGYGEKLKKDNQNTGQLLADTLIGSGLLIDQETFISLHSALVPN